MFSKFEQGTRDLRIKGQKACGCQLFIGFAQAGSEYRDQIAITVVMQVAIVSRLMKLSLQSLIATAVAERGRPWVKAEKL
jgi:hypothetical protein